MSIYRLAERNRAARSIARILDLVLIKREGKREKSSCSSSGRCSVMAVWLPVESQGVARRYGSQWRYSS